MNKAKAIAVSDDHNETWQLVMLMLLTVAVYLLFISPVFAGIFDGIVVPTSKMAQVICSIYGMIAFDIARGLAVLAITGLGVGAMLGRVTWGQVATVAVGIGVSIGAIAIVYALLPVSLGASVSLVQCGVQAKLAQNVSWTSWGNSIFGIR